MLDWESLAKLEPFASATRVSLDADDVIRFRCECGNHIVMSEKFAGRMAKCATCGRTVSVPDPYAPLIDEKVTKSNRRKRILAGTAVILILIAAPVIWYLVLKSNSESNVVTGVDPAVVGASRSESSAVQEAEPADENENALHFDRYG